MPSRLALQEYNMKALPSRLAILEYNMKALPSRLAILEYNMKALPFRFTNFPQCDRGPGPLNRTEIYKS